jgi:cytochrome P450
VRINPREIHIRDPYFFNQIYNTGVQDKDRYMVNISTAPLSTFATVDYHLHRSRRGILNPFFSRQSVFKVEDIVQEKVGKVTTRLETAHQNGSAVFLDDIFAALTADIISDYAYGKSLNVLDDKNFRNSFRDALTSGAPLCHMLRFFPLLLTLLDRIPSVIQWLSPSTAGLFDMKRGVEQQSREAIQKSKSARSGQSARTIYDALTDSSVPAEERTMERLRDEGMVVLSAGTETTARVLSMGAFYIYRDEHILRKLREELEKALPTLDENLSWTQLEKLPYLVRRIFSSIYSSREPVVNQFAECNCQRVSSDEQQCNHSSTKNFS